jgi:hypothetical protein
MKRKKTKKKPPKGPWLGHYAKPNLNFVVGLDVTITILLGSR